MNRRMLPIVPLLGALGLIVGSAAAARADDVAANPFDFLNRYSRIHSVHLIAHATISMGAHDDYPAQRGKGEVEFWADGERYRLRCVSPQYMGLAADVDVAFDGEHKQWFDRETGFLRVRKGDDSKTRSSIPNPFFLPVDFLNRETDSCLFCTVRLVDIQDKVFRDARLRTARPSPQVNAQAKSEMPEYDVDGPVYMGNRLTYRVGLGTAMGATIPVRLTRFNSDGSRADVVFSNFSAVSVNTGPSKVHNAATDASGSSQVIDDVGPLPLKIEWASYDHEGNNLANVIYTIDLIEVNRGVPTDVFTISQEQAKVVWDSDAGAFTKHYNPEIENRNLLPPRK